MASTDGPTSFFTEIVKTGQSAHDVRGDITEFIPQTAIFGTKFF